MAQDDGSAISEEIRSMIGIELDPKTYRIDESMVARFTEVLEDISPLLTDKRDAGRSGYGNAAVPPTFLINLFSLEQDEWARLVNCPIPKVLAGGLKLNI